mmetsp:Transcript_19578/g.34907  ORF Transcript_19578/g.34907 Transcript_19578/m.34907 type:complete len:614 (+) Transcript_19578:147-1988(+)|eukprot:CAMPEP_0197522470 /NCGR_PEP_ID=MMETSP1318-20131121/7614_1 /TAXON_ID=552666 /ORGANISM="Partenskyella glossopodia, Strain RCC365" /LENGTH=613 /DNA_ID=CAMNT_0043074867 /DNA_START=155 /DNA_END=1996 /DNA_ORIENTATION=+
MEVENASKPLDDSGSAHMEVEQNAQMGMGENEKSDELLVSVLIDELQNDDVQIRLNSMRKLSTIAKALGPERTIHELVPYLREFVDDEDDILIVLSEQLGGLQTCVGGSENAHVLLGPLETLSGIEDAVVRDKAVESIKKIVSVLDDNQIEQYMVPLVKRLATGKWFTSRISSSSLFEQIYSRVVAEQQNEMRGLFVQLCEDDTPMVRRAACQQLGKFANVVDYKYVMSEIVPAMRKLTKDAQDSVRLRTVENCVMVANLLNPEDRQIKILPVVYALCEDKSWRVRYMVADKFCSLTEAVGEEKKNRMEMINIFVRLLSDGEAEVRTAAAQKVTEIAKLVGEELTTDKLMKPVEALAKDECQHTRAALASVIMGLAACAPKRVVLEHLLPQYLQLLKDEDPEVRLNIISKLETVNSVIGVELLSQSLLPAVDDLAKDKKWRIRLAILKYIPLLARKLGPDLFREQLCEQCVEWMRDTVWSIRIAAAENLKSIAAIFESKWTTRNFIPEVKALAESKKPGHRMSAVYAIGHLCEVMGATDCKTQLVPLALALARDRVANIRFKMAGVLENMTKYVEEQVVGEELLPCLIQLSQDEDKDVVYFAAAALENVKAQK